MVVVVGVFDALMEWTMGVLYFKTCGTCDDLVNAPLFYEIDRVLEYLDSLEGNRSRTGSALASRKARDSLGLSEKHGQSLQG